MLRTPDPTHSPVPPFQRVESESLPGNKDEEDADSSIHENGYSQDHKCSPGDKLPDVGFSHAGKVEGRVLA